MSTPAPAGTSPPAEEVLAVIRDAVVTVFEVDPATVTRETSFVEDLRADSLALVEVVEIVEEALAARVRPDFHMDDDDLAALRTVGDAVDYAVARL